ncbi:hypothetical protein RCL_jg4100.t1 [Rhizophagus clarus]|uniref:Uncharacterized protein n=1 Tax=Rhizophagus clarus TaxID=94130 RepID=A0A8H3R1K8_9GLOM|nr:hypothetical protein RCL_jg4100.t1 [Rhizophagus clarus]
MPYNTSYKKSEIVMRGFTYQRSEKNIHVLQGMASSTAESRYSGDKCWAEPEIIFSDPLQEELVLVELILSSLDMGEQVSAEGAKGKDTYELMLGISTPRLWP